MDPITIGLGIASVGASLFGKSKADKQAKEQNRLQERQIQLSEQEYYGQQQRIQEWNEKYGSLESNMLHYVQNLDATKIVQSNSGAVKKAFESARQNADSHLAQRGFDVAGGVHAEMFTQLADQEAQATIQLQQQAEQYVLQTQQATLQGNPMPNNPSTANMSNAIGNQMQTGANNYAMQMDATADVLGSISAFGKGVQKAQAPKLDENAVYQERIINNSITANSLGGK